jgi:hypothetical protein
MLGVGGTSRWQQFDGGLSLRHEHGGITSIALPMAIVGTPGTPSLLGRDVLSQGVLIIDGPKDEVSFDIPPGFVR